MSECIFCKIRDGEIPKEFTYQDRDFMVFPDINPVRPIHLLIVTKKHIEDFVDLADSALWKKLYGVLAEMIEKYKLTGKGYRLVVNAGGAQIIKHFHVHVVAPVNSREKVG